MVASGTDRHGDKSGRFDEFGYGADWPTYLAMTSPSPGEFVYQPQRSERDRLKTECWPDRLCRLQSLALSASQ